MPRSASQDVLPSFSPSAAVVAAAVTMVAGMVGVVVAAGVEESPSLAVFSDLSLL